ncbi:Membrane protein [Helicobacter sp. NHP19-012]|uniref:Membrane protein n=1 Tax=Helicobacter gastrofelis TaxID=2849642 RepID=A0ABN6I8B9_9HELI|nr:hypothetical protein [Helicobacter sp. NHP19-012]BCZ19267.1 Membrane protein [Helicobacter sp. NHP19-012]
MKFSYSKPFPKHMLDLLAKIWLFYILLSMGVVYGLTYLLQKYIEITKSRTEISQVQGRIYSHESHYVQERIEHTRQALKSAQSKASHITSTKDSIRGILEIIPDSITINSITIDYSSLVLKGVVPSKEVFKRTIQQRLNSIFENSNVKFYPLSNGWFSFVSINSSVLPYIEKASD